MTIKSVQILGIEVKIAKGFSETKELVGIPSDFDLRKHQATLREQYGNLKLESLDTSAYAYNDLKLWRMFIPQDVRTCQEFNPKVYEIPKEKLKELQQRGELDAEALEAAQIEAYRQTYVEQPIQNVLEVVGRTAGVGQRSRPVADCAVVRGIRGRGNRRCRSMWRCSGPSSRFAT